MKNKILALVFFIIIIVLVIVLKMQSNQTNIDSNISAANLTKDEEKDIIKKYKVDIKGAIKKPGVYEIESDKRVIDVIKMSGGLKSNANTNYINLSARVQDEMVIWIYTTSEIDKLKLSQSSSEYMIKSCNCPVVDNTTCLNNTNNGNNKNSIVNINEATIEQLMNLEGIGESKAKSIIEYRNKNGKFIKPEDIMNVNGIGESLYNKIKENITV